MSTLANWPRTITLALAACACLSNVALTAAQDEKLPPMAVPPGRIIGPSDEVAEICIIGRSLRNQGQYDAALAEFEMALKTARSTKDYSGEAWSISNIATVYRYRAEKEPEKAAELIKTATEHYEQAANIARKNADKYNEAYATLYLGVLAAMRKDVAEADRRYAVALPLFRAVNDRYYVGRTYAYQARAALLRSEPKQAIELFEKALPLLRDVRMLNEVEQVTEELKAAKAGLQP
jgi:tetratricopeptide (TPR) repeat protein